MAINALSLVLVPITVLLAYFGLGTKDIDPQVSLFDYHHYWKVYLVAVGLAFIPTLAAGSVALVITALTRPRTRRVSV